MFFGVNHLKRMYNSGRKVFSALFGERFFRGWPMYYSSIGILAILILFTNEFYILTQVSKKNLTNAHRAYKAFLIGVAAYYAVDIAWGPLDAYCKIVAIRFAETSVYFAVMALSVLLWTRYVIAYINQKNRFETFIKITGIVFMILQVTVLIINLFVPIAFWYDEDGNYCTGIARKLNHTFQLLMFMIVSIYMFVISARKKGNLRRRHLAIGIFSATMVAFIILQNLYVLMPFYSIGLMLGTCLLHTFVIEDEKEIYRQKIDSIIQIEQLQEKELDNTRKIAYVDPLTGVKNKAAYIEDVDGIEQRIEGGILSKFGLIVFDVNDLKKVNDTKGHTAGDGYIKKASSIISEHFKDSPVYRIGGDGFVVFLHGDDYDNSNELLKEFDSLIEENLKSGDIVISSGFADYNPNLDKGFIRLFERADKEMYAKKQELKAKKNDRA